MVKKDILLAYDISNDRRRKKLSDILEGYGTRINKSVFLCSIKAGEEATFYDKVLQTIKRIDSVYSFPLCGSCIDKSIAFHQHKPTRRQRSSIFINAQGVTDKKTREKTKRKNA